MPTRVLHDLLDGALDLVFAPACAACRGPIPTHVTARGICAACWARTRPVPLPRCDRCWSPLPDLGVTKGKPDCQTCPTLRPAVVAVRSAFVLEGPVRAMVHALKYNGWHSIGKPMAERMAPLASRTDNDPPECVVPVPLSPARRRQRGYNQAGVLATSLASSAGLPYAGEILRKRPGASTQTTLHPEERRANVARAFWVDAARVEPISGAHAMLVDDVWTTGATALACAEALLDAGARAVSVLTFARALPELERHARRIELLDTP